MSDVSEYLSEYCQRAADAGLKLKKPGLNWVSMPDLVRDSHVSLSVTNHQIQVNLNNEQNYTRERFDGLFAQRSEIASAIDRPLSWDKKEGRKKTAVRATYPAGFGDRSSWADQHAWAIETMGLFEREFGLRSGASER